MTERLDSYMDGQPCWVDLATADTAAAKLFYTELFGWTYLESEPELGDFDTCLLNGKPVAALTRSRPEGPDADSTWRVLLARTDIPALTALTEGQGGAVVSPPASLMRSAGQAVTLRDPTGAVFGAWQVTPPAGFGAVGVPGSVVWTTLTTSDGAVADNFYRQLFGYETEEDGTGLGYAVWSLGGEKVCGRMVMGPGYPAGVPSHWMPYFGVANAAAAAETAVVAGGKVQAGPFETPMGTVLILLDATGATCCVAEVPA